MMDDEEQPTACAVAEMVANAIEDHADDYGFDTVTTSSYQEAGLLTRDAGFVLHLGHRGSFQVTVVRCR